MTWSGFASSLTDCNVTIAINQSTMGTCWRLRWRAFERDINSPVKVVVQIPFPCRRWPRHTSPALRQSRTNQSIPRMRLGRILGHAHQMCCTYLHMSMLECGKAAPCKSKTASKLRSHALAKIDTPTEHTLWKTPPTDD